MHFFLNKQGWRTATPTLSVSERRSKASPNPPRGGAKHGGTTLSQQMRVAFALTRSEATEGDSGKPFPVPLRAVARRLGDTTIGISTIKGGFRHSNPERQRTEKQGFSQYPSGWCEARGYEIISTNKGVACATPLFVEIPGFEPGQTEPKSVVLPLHHTSIHPGKDRTIFSICQICT